MTFDTLAVATELKDAGFPPEQAGALARAWSHVASGDISTKSDLIGTESRLEKKIDAVRSDLEKKIDAVHSDNVLLKWMIRFSLGLSLLILGKLFAVHY